MLWSVSVRTVRKESNRGRWRRGREQARRGWAGGFWSTGGSGCWVLKRDAGSSEPKFRDSRGFPTVACACDRPWPLLRRWPGTRSRDNRRSASPPRWKRCVSSGGSAAPPTWRNACRTVRSPRPSYKRGEEGRWGAWNRRDREGVRWRRAPRSGRRG